MWAGSLITILLLLAVAPGLALAAELPLFFLPSPESNLPIRYTVRTSNLQAGFAPGFVAFRAPGVHFRMRFAGANDHVTVDGVEPLPGKANFLKGREAQAWRTAVPIYRQIVYRRLYAGIDMTYRGDGARLKSEFQVAPGADPNQIRIDYEDAESVSIVDNGDLVVSAGGGELRERAPAIHQNSGPQRVPVEGHFRMLGPHTVGFEIGVYDSSRSLIIDPVVSYCTYLGGSGTSAVTGIAADPSGNVYATGWTEALDFPIAGAIQASNQGGVDAFVVKMNAAGTALLYATYIGGQGDDRGAGIAVNSSGQAYVTGSTSSANFPLASPVRSRLAASRSAFALKLNASGSGLLYSTYLGGSNYDLGNAIAVDSSGDAYIAGDTLSTDFPVLKAVQPLAGGNMDAFVTELTPSGSIVFSTFLGGAANDHAGGIAVDSSRNIYIVGGTFSTNFPVVNAIQSVNAGAQDAFAAKLSAGGATIIYSTYFGGGAGSVGSPEQANAIAVDGSGNAYLAGATPSTNFPVTVGALRTTFNGGHDAFVLKINAAGSTLTYGTYLGGELTNWASGIATDSSGNAFVCGFAEPPGFPAVGALQPAFAGAQGAFIAILNPTGNSLSFSSLYGGSQVTSANAIALDSTDNIYLGGGTNSTDLPLVGAIQTSSFDVPTGWLMRVAGGVGVASTSAQFVKFDTTTQGNWKGVYGADGYNVIGNAVSYPSYVVPVPAGNSSYTWPPTTDVRALQQANSAGRIAAVWYAASSFTIDLPFTGSQVVQVAVYCLDFDGLGRAQRMDILDANNNLLDSRSLTTMSNGVWAVWSVSGHVQLRLTQTAGPNAVLNGLFFAGGIAPPVTVTVSPPSVTLTPNQTQLFAATVANASNTAVTWSISPNAGSVNANTGLYTAPSTIVTSQTVIVTATSQANGTSTGTATISLSPPAGSGATAQFVKLDTTTQGNWKGEYGADGYNVINNAVSYPAYVTPSPSGNLSYTWPPTTDARALQDANSSGRIAAVWYAATSFTIDLPFTGSQAVQMAVYCLDFDGLGRAQRMDILDANNNLLDSRSLASMSSGEWVVWNLSGHVQLRLTQTAGPNAVLNGLFFTGGVTPPVTVTVSPPNVTLTANQIQPFTATVANATNIAATWSINPSTGGINASTGLYTAPSTITSSQTVTVTATSQANGTSTGTATISLSPPSGPAATAQFVKLDTTTQGSWKGVYGSDGYNVISNAINYPAYVAPSPSGNSSYTWPLTTDARALQQASSSGRIAAVWYAASSFTIDLPFTGSQAYQLAVYCLDFDGLGRAQRMDILDASNNLLDSRSLTSMTNGVWVVWNLSGHVRLRLTQTAGPNAVLNGLFFSGGVTASVPATAQFVKLDTATQGNWIGAYGADGYNVIDNAISYPPYVTPTSTGNSNYTWPSTNDVRALQQANSSGRIAAVWYAAGSFTIDLPFTGSQVVQMAVYCLDFDGLGRAQRMDILDANNNLLDSRSLTSMNGGVWVVWNLSGHVQLRLTQTAGPNAVLNGLFFAP